MKRKAALLLSFIFIFTLALPVQGFAASVDKALENAIKIAKTKFSVPESYKFTSSISTEGTKKIFYLTWRSSDNMETSINVRIDENGSIIGYNKYSPGDYIQTKKLPKYSRQDAKTKADGYIKWIEPGLLEKLKYSESTQANIMDTSYYLSYYRIVNGVPYYSDRVTVTVNRDTGELQDYSRQWTDNLIFPSAANAISAKKAEEAYVSNLGLRLMYKSSYINDELKAYLVYAPVYDNGSYGVNALTGERQRLSDSYFYNDYGGGAMFDTVQKASASHAKEEVKLNPDELNAVQNAAKLISQEEAEKIARSSKFLNISADSKLQSYYLGNSWPSKDEYQWSLNFNKPAGDTSKYDEYTSVTINAKTGLITSFYRGAPNTGNTKPVGDMAAAKASVEAFLTENYPEFFKQVEYDKLSSESYNSAENGINNNYNFIYSRLVNGTVFPDNGVNINYDNMNGMIISFNINWYNNLTFPATSKVIGTAAASDRLFKNVGLALEYRLEYGSMNDQKIMPAGNYAVNAKVVPVYAFKQDKPLHIDANTGSLLNYDGTAYKEQARINYTDIKGHAAEKQIMVLAENGVYLEGAQFKPDSAITQKDFMILLSKTLNYYSPVRPLSTDKEVDDL